jgi:tripartite-type tricarboxylate transporter receptor subunit TctC
MTARLVAPVLEKELGTPVQVVNKPGGATLMGLTEAALAKPDGHTILVLGLPGNLTAYLDPDRGAVPQVRELQPVASQNLDVGAVLVNAESPYRTVKDLVNASKASPAGLKGSTDGLVGSDHMASLQFMKKTGAKFKLVHFDGGAPATTALAGGHVDLRIGKVGSAYALMKSGKVRATGVMDKQRSKYCPDAPTLEEQGYADYTYYNLTGFAVPKGTPRAIVDILSTVLKKTIDNEEAKKKLDGVALIGHYMGTDEFAAYWKNAEKVMEPLILEAKKQ